MTTRNPLNLPTALPDAITDNPITEKIAEMRPKKGMSKGGMVTLVTLLSFACVGIGIGIGYALWSKPRLAEPLSDAVNETLEAKKAKLEEVKDEM